jgi:ribonuclease D
MDESASNADRPCIWIDSQLKLENTLAANSSKVVALDTEFIRTNTFFPKPGIIQLLADGPVILIDPQQIKDWSPLSQLFSDTSVLKVVHACGEDLELFYSLNIAQPRPLFDTQVASALLGEELNEGLQKLAARILGLHLSKRETRSDWTRRPLTDEQIHYAKEDVLILLPIWKELQARLACQGKAEIILQEGALLASQAANPTNDKEVYLKLRGGWKLTPTAQQLLSQLAAWREKTARLADRPRRFVCSDNDLIQIAQYRPTSLGRLTQYTELQGTALGRYGKEITEIVLYQQDHLPDFDDFALIRPPLPRSVKELYQTLKQRVHNVASARGIQPTLLASRTMLEGLMHWHLAGRQGAAPLLMTAWRREWVGESLSALLQQYSQSAQNHKEVGA